MESVQENVMLTVTVNFKGLKTFTMVSEEGHDDGKSSYLAEILKAVSSSR